MSKRQLVDAYLGGRITRRSFIGKLTRLGVSLGAAAAYANVLAGEARADGPTGNGNGAHGIENAMKHAAPQAKRGLQRALSHQAKHKLALGADFYR